MSKVRSVVHDRRGMRKKISGSRFKPVLFAMLPYFYTVLTIVSKGIKG